jgi:hypothetical protein
VTPRPTGRRQPAGQADARARLADAEAFLETATLARALSRKTQAAYESRDMSTTDAATCVRQATTLLEAARSRARPT